MIFALMKGWWLTFARLPRAAHIAIGLVALIAAFLIWDHFDDKAAVNDFEAEQEAKAAPAREKAAEQRAQDAIINTKSEEDMHHAIDSAPKGGDLSPAAHALACERLRKLGRVPPTCRSEGTD